MPEIKFTGIWTHFSILDDVGQGHSQLGKLLPMEYLTGSDIWYDPDL